MPGGIDSLKKTISWSAARRGAGPSPDQDQGPVQVGEVTQPAAHWYSVTGVK